MAKICVKIRKDPSLGKVVVYRCHSLSVHMQILAASCLHVLSMTRNMTLKILPWARRNNPTGLLWFLSAVFPYLNNSSSSASTVLQRPIHAYVISTVSSTLEEILTWHLNWHWTESWFMLSPFMTFISINIYIPIQQHTGTQTHARTYLQCVNPFNEILKSWKNNHSSCNACYVMMFWKSKKSKRFIHKACTEPHWNQWRVPTRFSWYKEKFPMRSQNQPWRVHPIAVSALEWILSSAKALNRSS